MDKTTGSQTGERLRKKEIRRMRTLLPLVVAVMVGMTTAVLNRCSEPSSCKELSSESSMMKCFQLCGVDPHEVTTILGSVLLQPPSSVFLSPSPFPSSSPAKYSYSMEHFRWGKPLGRKRNLVKIPTGKWVDEIFPGEMRKWELSKEKTEAEDEEQVAQNEAEQLSNEHQDEKDILYKMKHFRWSGPVTGKRYGGFMRSWEEHSKRPLLTLFRNVINKEEEKEK